MSLFTMHNIFDDITVTLDNDTPDAGGPCVVTLICGDDSIGTEPPEVFRFDTIAEGKAKFMSLVSGEIDSVLQD